MGKTGIRQCAFLEEVNVNHNLKETEVLSVQEEKEKEWYFIENEELENQESQPSDYSFHLYGRGGNNKIRNILMVTVGTTHMTQYSLFNSLKLSSLDLQEENTFTQCRSFCIFLVVIKINYQWVCLTSMTNKK